MKQSNRFPSHVAIIMDGNRRWAERQGLSTTEGHRAGIENMRRVLEHLSNRGLKYLTVYAFSTENWQRNNREVQGLLGLLEEMIDEEVAELHRRGARIRHIGRLEGLPPAIQEALKRGVELTSSNAGTTVSFAFNYGARTEILDAVRRIVADGLPPQDIDEKLFNSYLYTADLPDVDLVIRTGGEVRLSNFLMWQAAYSEYYFTNALWPDFDKEEIDKALLSYSQRERRFGGD
ncbi:MAG: di-trans,poly-cis-decaprenylcistransferase [Chloroflexi bacterium]|nr:di-trans,poly-cis-decaprenylcistransferase [Chloroflexota bacterium]